AGQARDDERRPLGLVLGVVGVLDAEHVAGELDDHVLHPRAGGQQGHVGRARVLDGPQRPLRAAVGAPRRDQQAVEPGQLVRRVADLVGGDPRRLDPEAEVDGGVAEGVLGGGVGLLGRVVVTDDADVDHAPEHARPARRRQPGPAGSDGGTPATVRHVGLAGQHDDRSTLRRRAPGRPARRGPAVAVLVALLTGLAACGDDGDGGDDGGAAEVPPVEWVRVGYDLANTRAVEDEVTGGPDAVSERAPAWEVTGLDGVSGTPAVVDGTVYVGDWTGHVRALDAASGEELWAQQVSPGYIGGSVAVDGDR